MRSRSILALALASAAVLLLIVAGASAQGPLVDQEDLGKFLFHDKNLSLTATNRAPPATRRRPAGSARIPISMLTGRSTKAPSRAPSVTASRRRRLWRRQPGPLLRCSGPLDRRHVLGRPGHRLDPGRSPGRAGPGPLPEPEGAGPPRPAAVISIVQDSSYADLFAACVRAATPRNSTTASATRSPRTSARRGQPVHFQVRLLAERAGQVDRRGAVGRALFKGKASARPVTS